MSTTDVGNDYVDNAKLSWHVCGRCLAWMGKGDVRWLGMIGCCFPVPDAGNAHLFQDYMNSGVLKCFRCWEKDDACVVVPVELRGQNDELNRHLCHLRDNGWYVPVPNPAAANYVAPEGGDANQPEPTLREWHRLTADENDVAKFKIAKICAPLAETLSRKYKPYSAHLRLHNGAIDKADSPEGDLVPIFRDRSKKAVYTKNVATKRVEEAMVDKELKETMEDAGTPRKKQRFGVAYDDGTSAVEAQRVELRARIAALTAKRAKVGGATKGKITKDINKLLDDLGGLE